ncbi:ATP-binding protein [Flavivirga rizhaonensis]|nr:ATP-binding protein [Flavivirga rizhaonensis]
MSYEVRTPLSTVLGMLNMLKQTNLDSDQKAQVEIAEYSSKHLLQLVNMVTDNADVKIESLQLNLLAIDLKSDLFHLFKVFEYQAWEKGLEFDFKFLYEEKDTFSVLGDSARIQQVLINLINNAIKFTNSGKISIIVDQTVSIDEDQIVTFYIKDTGVGMRQEEIKRIFNNASSPYDASMMRYYKGGGIGLSISHQLVKLMGGDLKLESKENEGSTFYFSLQLKKTLNIKTENTEQQPILLDKFSVLVAEDNRMNQKVIKFLLERQGADCTFAKNGIEAVDLYKILDFDMVFMDIYMPDMDGYQATKAIQETEKYIKNNTPIIAVSASAFEEDINHAKSAGIDEFLAKPIETDRLKELLVKYSKKNSST